jgi:hypothetical protein
LLLGSGNTQASEKPFGGAESPFGVWALRFLACTHYHDSLLNQFVGANGRDNAGLND